MATLLATNVGLSTGWYSQYNIYSYNSTNGSLTYMHFKTNISNTANKIVMIEAIGYNYGFSSAIRSSWCFYAWNNLVIDKGRQNFYAAGGLAADGIYASSDGYAVIRAYSSNPYYIGYILNAHSGPAGYGTNVQITAANANTNSGAYY